MSAVIQAEKLCKWYGNILGVSDINLEIQPGIKGLLGPNGAGKSTFLKLAAGQLKPSIGWVRIFGEKTFANHRIYSRIGFCPEHDSFYPDMTGWQFIFFMARLHGAASPRRAGEMTEKALATVGLTDKKDFLIKTYSFGMRQRLRLSSSLVHEPELLFLDEPLRGIDPLWRIKIIRLIKEYEKAGKTIIVSSHVLSEIEAMTSDIILIHQGRVFAQGNIHYIRGLIDAHPHQISIRSNRPRQLAEKLVRLENVLSVELDEATATLIIKTNQRDQLFDFLTRFLAENDIEVDEITSPDDNLQAVFDYLIGR